MIKIDPGDSFTSHGSINNTDGGYNEDTKGRIAKPQGVLFLLF